MSLIINILLHNIIPVTLVFQEKLLQLIGHYIRWIKKEKLKQYSTFKINTIYILILTLNTMYN